MNEIDSKKLIDFINTTDVITRSNRMPRLVDWLYKHVPNLYEQAFKSNVSRGILIIRPFNSYKKYDDNYYAMTCIVPYKELEKIRKGMREVYTLCYRMPVEYKYLRFWNLEYWLNKHKIIDLR